MGVTHCKRGEPSQQLFPTIIFFVTKLRRDNMNSERQEKVGRFEEFIDQRLKPDLVHAIAERDKIFEQQKIFSDLRRNIENLEKNSVTSLRTLVNLGSEVYMQADVPDTRHIFVDVGLGFHVEFTWSEALKFIFAREEKLARQIEEYTRLIASIKAQIKMVHEGIRELLELPYPSWQPSISHSPNFWGVLSKTNMCQLQQFLSLLYPLSPPSFFRLHPLPYSPNHPLNPTPLYINSSSSPPTLHQTPQSHLLITLLYVLSVFLFSIFATASITYSTFHGFYDYNNFDFLYFRGSSRLHCHIEGFGSNYSLDFVIFYYNFDSGGDILLASGVVVGVCGGGIQMGVCTLEAECLFNYGDEMDHAINHVVIWDIDWIFSNLHSKLVSHFDGGIWDWGFIPLTVLCSGVKTILYVAAYTVFYVYWQGFTQGNGI
ncbi:Uncharacterized protein Adt_23959 [Abeliophyllum distichum]|uniref:Uncharacterized protein n=1 Tax=Abeliophyllum distichum TaxID=126358 RepID=A0ABD1SCB6_9LAMI